MGVTFFQIFVILGRFIASSLVGKIKVRTILIFLSFLALISIVLFVLSDSKFFIYLTISLVGLGFSAMYPLLLSSGSTLYVKGRGVLSSMIFASAYIGIAASPLITRKIGSFNLTFSILFALIFSVTATISIIFITYYEKYRLNRPEKTIRQP
ncbi:MAG: hypothetical protein WCJ54_06130 [Actinomycetota bacterium]